MASCLQASMNSLLTRSSSSFKSHPPSLSTSGRTNSKSFRHAFRAIASAKIPMPPINSNDPFLSTLASVAAQSSEKLLNRLVNSDTRHLRFASAGFVLCCAGTYSLCGSSDRSRMSVTFRGNKGNKG